MADTSLLAHHLRDELDPSSDDTHRNSYRRFYPKEWAEDFNDESRSSMDSEDNPTNPPISPEFYGFKTPSPAFRGFATPSPSEKFRHSPQLEDLDTLDNEFSEIPGITVQNIGIDNSGVSDSDDASHSDFSNRDENNTLENGMPVNDAITRKMPSASNSTQDFASSLSPEEEQILMDIKEEAEDNYDMHESVETESSNIERDQMEYDETESEMSFHSSTVHINIEIENTESDEEELSNHEEKDLKEPLTHSYPKNSCERTELKENFTTMNQSGLFIQPYTALPIVFGMKCGQEMRSIRQYIWDGGGAIENSDDIADYSGHRIELWNPDWDSSNVEVDIFDYQYIFDCVNQNKLLDNLKDYQIDKSSHFKDSDPMQILCGVKKWTDFVRKDKINDCSESIVSGSEIALDLALSSESGSSEVYPTEDICIQTHFTYLASNIQSQEAPVEKSSLHDTQGHIQDSPALNNSEGIESQILKPNIEDPDCEDHLETDVIDTGDRETLDITTATNASISPDRKSDEKINEDLIYSESENNNATPIPDHVEKDLEDNEVQIQTIPATDNISNELTDCSSSKNTLELSDRICYTSKKNKGKQVSSHSKLNRKNKRVSNELRRLNASNYFWCDELNSDDEPRKSKLRRKVEKSPDFSYSSNDINEENFVINDPDTETKACSSNISDGKSTYPCKSKRLKKKDRFEKKLHNSKSRNHKTNYSNDLHFNNEVTNPDDEPHPNSEYDNTICEYNDNHQIQNKKYITNWVPRLKGKKLLIEGNLLDFDHADPSHYKDRYITSKVLERKNSNLVITKGGEYWLEGNLNMNEAMKHATPDFIIESFAHGVPEKWKKFTKDWRGEKKGISQNNSYKTVVNYYVNCIINQNNSV